jgi:hypothetical protein
MTRSKALLVTMLVVALCGWSTEGLAKKKVKGKKKKKKENITKIIPKKEFTQALIKLAKDEREPVASSTLVEKGRGEDYYAVDKMLDDNPETFWAEGAKGPGTDQFVVFFVPDGTTHVEITPGAGKEQFENFNRPKRLYVDYYFVKLKREKDGDEYKPKFKWLGRSDFKFKNKPQTVRRKVGVKLPEVVVADRTMYVGVIIIRSVFKGQFDDTSIATLRTSAVWGEE